MYAGKLVLAQITEHLPLPVCGNASSVMVAITNSNRSHASISFSA